jgi:tetratricopeptide (TPR) repeat protein
MDRIATFKQFVSERPDDPFPLYGLAMEHKNGGDLEAAGEVFEQLARKFPEYVPLYLMSGSTLEALGRQQDAADVYRRGIEMSGSKGDQHAKSELETALAQLDDS